MNLLRRMTEAERDVSGPAVRPRDAATLILVDRTASPVKVLLGKRHHGHKFMPGKYVFPGGRVEALDRRIADKGLLDAPLEMRLKRKTQKPSSTLARALVVAAIRETFEETGLLLGIDKVHAPTTATAERLGGAGQCRCAASDCQDSLHRPRGDAAGATAPVRHALLHRRRQRHHPSARRAW